MCIKFNFSQSLSSLSRSCSLSYTRSHVVLFCVLYSCLYNAFRDSGGVEMNIISGIFSYQTRSRSLSLLSFLPIFMTDWHTEFVARLGDAPKMIVIPYGMCVWARERVKNRIKVSNLSRKYCFAKHTHRAYTNSVALLLFFVWKCME
jgi:hypothetical protein